MIDFKKIDQHTPDYYFQQFKQAFSSTDTQVQSAGTYGLIFGFAQDFYTLCPGGANKFPPDHVREAVNYLDRKYTATIQYFNMHGVKIQLPPNGWKESFLESRKDVREAYGSDRQIIL